MLLGRRRDRADPGRQQQRLLPGQRRVLVRLGQRRRDFLAWTADVIRFRRDHPVFRRRRFFQKHPVRGAVPEDRATLPDVGWFRPDGQQMTDDDWDVGYAKSLAVFLNGLAIADPDAARPTGKGRLVLSAHQRRRGDVVHPPRRTLGHDLDSRVRYRFVLGSRSDARSTAGESVKLESHSVRVLRRISPA